MKPRELRAILRLLRDAGVQCYRDGDFQVVLAPRPRELRLPTGSTITDPDPALLLTPDVVQWLAANDPNALAELRRASSAS
jgi:hypothetical protein